MPSPADHSGQPLSRDGRLICSQGDIFPRKERAKGVHMETVQVRVEGK